MSLNEAMTVDVPEGELDGMRVERFTVSDFSVSNLRLGHRGTRPGTYTRLREGRRLWMSDTDAEKRDHLPAVNAICRHSARRVLVNGLGLGMVVRAALMFDHVEHVDVVEVDARVLALVGQHYATDPRVHLHHADAYEQARAWPPGTRWDVGWSDIWAGPSTDTLTDMARLRRSYARRTTWHDCWARTQLLAIRDEERRQHRRSTPSWARRPA